MFSKQDVFIRWLRSYPLIKSGFCPMQKWITINECPIEREAWEIFSRKENAIDHPNIEKKKSVPHIIAFLRYDYKKILVRNRYLYLDKNLVDGRYILKEPKETFAYFDPLLICFSFAEGLSTFLFTNNKLRNYLETLKNGYKEHSCELVQIFRNGIAHAFRPRGEFIVDLNTENKYSSPTVVKNVLKIDIPHFFDTLAVNLEQYFEDLKGENSKGMVEKYISGLDRLEKKQRSAKNSRKRCC